MTRRIPSHFQCPPGTRVVLQVTGMPDKLPTICVGQSQGRFVIVQLPTASETGREIFYQMLYPENEVIGRFLYEGTVVGFSARCIKSIQIPFPLLFLTFPDRLETLTLRKHRRIACCLPGQAAFAGESFEGMILDLSLSGCQFSASFGEKTPAVAIDDPAELQCGLFGPENWGRLPCSVMRVAVAGRRVEIGLKFRDIPRETRDALFAYLEGALSILG